MFWSKEESFIQAQSSPEGSLGAWSQTEVEKKNLSSVFWTTEESFMFWSKEESFIQAQSNPAGSLGAWSQTKVEKKNLSLCFGVKKNLSLTGSCQSL